MKKIIEKIKEFIANYKKHRAQSRICRYKEYAKERYQIQEYDGKVWLIVNNALVCPADMLNGDILEALKKMRDLYVERNTKK